MTTDRTAEAWQFDTIVDINSAYNESHRDGVLAYRNGEDAPAQGDSDYTLGFYQGYYDAERAFGVARAALW